MGTLVLAIGLVLVVEGLAYALAPALLERMLVALQTLTLDQRRLLGLGSLAAGVALIWLSHAI